MARVVAGEFGLQRLDRAARYAGEAFAAPDDAYEAAPAQPRGMALPWLGVIALALLGLTYIAI